MFFVMLILAALCAFFFMTGFFYAVKQLVFDKVFKINFLLGVAALFALTLAFSLFAIALASAR